MAPPLLVVAVATLLPLLVGVTGFEPATLCSQSRCATKLRYTPMDVCPLPHHTGGDSKCRARGRLTLGSCVSPSGVRGCSSMVEPLPSKQITRVRFPSSAPQYGKPRASWPGAFFCSHPTMLLTWGVIGHFVLLGLVPGVVVGLGRDDGGRWQAWPRQISHII